MSSDPADNIYTEAEEDRLRALAREEAQAVYEDLAVESSDGRQWSLRGLMERFEIDRRTALKAMGLIAVGFTAPAAVLKAISEPAAAAPTDDLTVPGTLDAGDVVTGSLVDASSGNSYDVDDLSGGFWTVESGSPYTATGGSSANSINPSGLDSFDIVKVLVRYEDQAGSGSNVSLTVNGDTGSNYDETYYDGSSSQDQSEWGIIDFAAANAVATLELEFHAYQGGLKFMNLSGAESSGAVETGANTNVSHPLSSFTLSRGADTDWEVDVVGRNVAT